jgi:beta-glucanase (GH16 family)
MLLALFSLALTGWGGRCNGGDPLEIDPEENGGGEFVLAWEDEFEGPAGQLPDSDKWGYDVGGGGWGNAQLEYDTDRPTNVSLDGEGHLAITARRENYLGREYTSARINTKGLFTQERGRFEARIKLPVGQGIWPAFWLLGANFETVGWPDCGEIDIMEYRGQEPNILHGSLHGPGYSGGDAITQHYTLPGAEGFNGDFHVFAVEWEADTLTWFVDSTTYHVVTPSSLPRGGSWVFDHPFFIILNVAVGGYFVGSPDATTTFPQTMLVDYVRVYRSTR